MSDAIGIAELFVQACSGKMKSMFDGIGLGSGVTKAEPEDHVTKEFFIHFEPKPESHFEVNYWNREQSNSRKYPKCKVRMGQGDFVPLLKLNCQADWDKDMTEPVKDFLIELGFKLPHSKFRVRDGNELL